MWFEFRIRYNNYDPNPTTSVAFPTYLPRQFSLRIALTHSTRKTRAVDLNTSIGEFFEIIFRNYSKFLEKEHKSLKKSDYILKFRGKEEYLLDEKMKFWMFETIRNLLRNDQKVELVLIEKKAIQIPNWEKLTDFGELVSVRRKLPKKIKKRKIFGQTQNHPKKKNKQKREKN